MTTSGPPSSLKQNRSTAPTRPEQDAQPSNAESQPAHEQQSNTTVQPSDDKSSAHNPIKEHKMSSQNIRESKMQSPAKKPKKHKKHKKKSNKGASGQDDDHAN